MKALFENIPTRIDWFCTFLHVNVANLIYLQGSLSCLKITFPDLVFNKIPAIVVSCLFTVSAIITEH